MGLFGKSNQLAKQVADQEKQKQKQATAKTKVSGKSLYSGLLAPSFTVLLVFLSIGLGQRYLFVDSVEKAVATQSETFSGIVMLESVNKFITDREVWISDLSQRPFVNELIQRGQDSSVMVEASKAAWTDLEALYLIPGAKLPRIQQHYPDLSFASIDLLRSASKGSAVKMEAFRHQDRWLLQIVAKTAAGDGEQEGFLLATFNLSIMERLINLPFGLIGQVVVKSDSSSSTEIVSRGTTFGGIKQEYSSANGWNLSIEVRAKSDILGPERFIFWVLLGAGGVICLLGIIIVIRLQLHRIRKDLILASQGLKASISGEGKKSPKIRYSEVNSLFLSVKSLLKESNPRPRKTENAAMPDAGDSKDSVETRVPADELAMEHEESDAPMFEDDLLDLDILGEAETDSPISNNEEAMVTEVNQLDLDVPQSIFRAYDIRGIVDETLNEGVVELIGKAFATEALLQGKSAVCVGYDGRLSSEAYCDALTRGIVSTGADAIVIGLVPTPVLYFSTHQLETGTGVMITGSHNPGNYNGFKMMIAGKTLANDDIQGLYNRIVLQDFKEGLGARTEQEVSRMYLDTILNDIAVAAPLKVVVDAGNGVAGELGPALVEELGCEVVPLFCDIDGTFPNHHPDPGKPKNLQDLIAAVKEHDAHIGLAFDGDGDRVGVVTNEGKIIWPDRLLMLFAKDVVSRNPGADVIFDVKCSRRLNGLISGYGGRPIMWKTGHSLIKSKMKETGALLAGEMSGHVFFKERWFGFDDGLYSAARLLEILGVEDRTAEEVFAAFPEDISTPEINIEVTDENKFDLVEKLCARAGEFGDGNPSTIDGLRVDFKNGWGLCRASNTTPMLVLRFEADNEAALEEIKEKFKAQLAIVDSSLPLDF